MDALNGFTNHTAAYCCIIWVNQSIKMEILWFLFILSAQQLPTVGQVVTGRKNSLSNHFYMKVAGLRFFNPTRAILLYAWYASTLHLCLPLSVGLTSTLPHSPSLSSPFHPSWELFPWDLPSAYNKQTQITTFICLYNFLVFCNLSTYLYDKIRVFFY